MFFLSDYFDMRKRRVEFVNQTCLGVPDIIFYDASRSIACLIAGALRSGMKDCVVFSLYDGKPSLATWRLGRWQKSLSTCGDLQQLCFYLDTLWHELKIPAASKSEAKEKDILTTRQRQIMRLLAKGITPAEISARLNISVKTVSSHRGGGGA
ncbi:response regulator transcription factor [Serratia marcescens]|uniref:response regulator transcription factor n=1 Tax=Serratia marcescens TaxID=615 RepID=UPI0039B3DF99